MSFGMPFPTYTYTHTYTLTRVHIRATRAPQIHKLTHSRTHSHITPHTQRQTDTHTHTHTHTHTTHTHIFVSFSSYLLITVQVISILYSTPLEVSLDIQGAVREGAITCMKQRPKSWTWPLLHSLLHFRHFRGEFRFILYTPRFISNIFTCLTSIWQKFGLGPLFYSGIQFY